MSVKRACKPQDFAKIQKISIPTHPFKRILQINEMMWLSPLALGIVQLQTLANDFEIGVTHTSVSM